MSTATIDHPVVALPALRRGRAGARSLHHRPVARTARRERTWRLTRRGRLAVTTTVTLTLLLAIASVLTVLGPAGATSSVVVEPGTTLTEVATEHMPDVPVSEAVVRIQQANRLSTTSVMAGQELVIPGR